MSYEHDFRPRREVRGGVDYDNRGAEPHRPWPRKYQVRRSRWRGNLLRFIAGVIIALVLVYLYDWQADCVETHGPSSRYCAN